MSDRLLNIGDFEMLRKPAFRYKDGCEHRRLETDDKGHIVTCRDCNQRIEPYWALVAMAEHINRETEVIRNQRKQHSEEMAKGVTLKAAQKVEKAWRKHKMVPACPHCLHAITPEDGFGETLLSAEDPEGARKSLIQTNKTLKIWTDDTRKS